MIDFTDDPFFTNPYEIDEEFINDEPWEWEKDE